jgi:anti-anti-sigma factor
VATGAPDHFDRPFQIHFETQGKATIVHLTGEFDLSVRKAFEAGLARVVSARPKLVVVDLREVAFIDSTGIRLILEAWNQSRRMSFDFAVRLGEGPVRSALADLGLDRALPVIEDVPESSRRFSAPGARVKRGRPSMH